MKVEVAKPRKVQSKPKAKDRICYVCEKPFRRGEARVEIGGRTRHVGCKPGSLRWNLSKWGVAPGNLAKALELEQEKRKGG